MVATGCQIIIIIIILGWELQRIIKIELLRSRLFHETTYKVLILQVSRVVNPNPIKHIKSFGEKG